MLAYLPPLAFIVSWALALVGWEPPGAGEDTPFDERALRWMLLIGLGGNVLGGFVMHTFFARPVAEQIGWRSGQFQYEVAFASLGMGVAAIYAASVDQPAAWVVGSIAGGAFLLLAGLNHIREMITERNFAPGNTVIVISDLGVPISLLALLISTGAL